MTTKAKQAARQAALDKLQAWHLEKGIQDFPKRLGLSVNEKKFREVSFRTRNNVKIEDSTPEDFIVSHTPVMLTTFEKPVAYIITYRVWFPSPEGKVKSTISIRFSFCRNIYW